MAWMEQLRTLDQRFELEADETAYKLHLVYVRRCPMLLGCLCLHGSFAVSQALWLLPITEERELSLGETIHCFSVFILSILTMILSIASALCPRSSWSWEPFWAFLGLSSSTLLATRWHMIPEEGPSTAMLTILSVVVSLAALPLRLWLSAILSCCAVLATFISSWLKSEGQYDAGAGLCFLILLLPIFWSYEKDQRQIVLQEAIRNLSPKPLAWTSVLGSGSSFPDFMNSNRAGRREVKAAVLRCRSDLRIEDCGAHEHAFFGEDVSGRELLNFFKGEDRKAVAMMLSDEIRDPVSAHTDCFQGRRMVARITLTGVTEPKWLAVFCKAEHAVELPSKSKLIDSSTQTPREEETNRNRTWRATPWEAGMSCPTTLGGEFRKAKRKASTLPLRPSTQAVQPPGRSRSPSLDIFPEASDIHRRDISEFGEVSLELSAVTQQRNESSNLEPVRSSSLGVPRARVSLLAPSDWRPSDGRSLSYSFSISQNSGSNNSKAKLDNSCQTDLVWSNLGWHCRACSKPPRPDAGLVRSQNRPAHASYSVVRNMQGGWSLLHGPVGVAEWLQEFMIAGTTVHSKTLHFPLLLGSDGSVEMAGGQLSLLADGTLRRVGKSGHSFYFQRADVEFNLPDTGLEQMQQDGEEEEDEEIPPPPRSGTLHSVRIGM
mmetsp:Transcript_5190/g.8800  ORF Transcript_5190/g.8800 Transcript_5190/m.8800 type:complete len:660 (+) Transcript_5190:35-2014(+)